MNQKDLIKYGLLALGAYLIYKYIQDHGGIEGLLGTTALATPQPAVTTGAPITTGGPTGATQTTQPTNTTQQLPVLDVTGLVVVPDVNGSFTGTVKINGVPIRLSIITVDGRIFDGSGQEVTGSLQSQGVDIAALRTAFANAGQGLSGLGATMRFAPAWLM
jgi:hypothetical protein